MTSLKAFRLLILAEVTSAAVGLVFGFLPDQVADEGPEASLAFIGMAFTFVALWITAIVGLWRFRRWARPLYVVAACGGLVLSFVPPYAPGSAVDDVIAALTWIVTGALLALMYYSPVAERFYAPPAA